MLARLPTMLRALIIASCLLFVLLRAPGWAGEEQRLGASRQCVLVVTADWPAVTGCLFRLERASIRAPWVAKPGYVEVVVGRTGLAPGLGFEALPGSGELRKKEGDGHAPAGVFPLGTAFGFGPKPAWMRVPYRVLGADTEAVDDPGSRYYNQIVDRGRVRRPDWRSAERMREEPLYRLGMSVGYNSPRPVPGAGSCIFLHCRNGSRRGTAGCTAMAERDLSALLAWLDPSADPVLVQLPRAVFEAVRAAWELPAI
jgi:L,D-peptidoglycan transpeptidase YkuD (ErfK/YbiS/YcfS/YnhG family)